MLCNRWFVRRPSTVCFGLVLVSLQRLPHHLTASNSPHPSKYGSLRPIDLFHTRLDDFPLKVAEWWKKENCSFENWYEFHYAAALLSSDRQRFTHKFIKFSFWGTLNYLFIAPEAFVAPTFGCASAKHRRHTMMFGIWQEVFWGYQTSGSAISSRHVAVFKAIKSWLRFFVFSPHLQFSIADLPSLCPFQLPMLSLLAAAVVRSWCATPTHLLCDLWTWRVQKNSPFTSWINFPPKLPIYSPLVIKHRDGVRRLILYSPPFPGPLAHLFRHDDIRLLCNEKITCSPAKTCVGDTGNREFSGFFFCQE